MIIKLSLPDAPRLRDATVHNSGLCVQMLDHLAENMASRYPNWRGSYTETLYPVRSGLPRRGQPRHRVLRALLLQRPGARVHQFAQPAPPWATLAALVLAGGLGLFMARRITVPLERIALSTQRIAAGHRDVTITGTTKVRELDGMSARTVNDLSRSLGEQEALRRRLTTDMAHEAAHPARYAPEPPRGADRRGVGGGARPARGRGRRSPPMSRTWKIWPGTRVTPSEATPARIDRSSLGIVANQPQFRTQGDRPRLRAPRWWRRTVTSSARP